MSTATTATVTRLRTDTPAATTTDPVGAVDAAIKRANHSTQIAYETLSETLLMSYRPDPTTDRRLPERLWAAHDNAADADALATIVDTLHVRRLTYGLRTAGHVSGPHPHDNGWRWVVTVDGDSGTEWVNVSMRPTRPGSLTIDVTVD